jgi:hypothetical protein
LYLFFNEGIPLTTAGTFACPFSGFIPTVLTEKSSFNFHADKGRLRKQKREKKVSSASVKKVKKRKRSVKNGGTKKEKSQQKILLTLSTY